MKRQPKPIDPRDVRPAYRHCKDDLIVPQATGANANIPWPVYDAIVYGAEEWFWCVAEQQWSRLQTASENERAGLVYVLVHETEEKVGAGEYVRVLYDPPFDREAFFASVHEMNPWIVAEEQTRLLPELDLSVHPTFRGIFNQIDGMKERLARRRGIVRLKSRTVPEAMHEIMGEVGVGILENSIQTDPLKTLELAANRTEGLPVKRVVEVKVDGATLNLRPSDAVMAEIRAKLIASVARPPIEATAIEYRGETSGDS